ncbi:MAG TPA: glycosyltransferase [Chloroflexia bacterium]|nr:glycosyltransferase [Chloroflexia bacterium]
MAMGLPVVTVDVAPLNEIARHECEGLLYRAGDMEGLVGAIERLVSDGDLRYKMGAAGRMRVTEKYSWQAHCVALARLLRKITHAR